MNYRIYIHDVQQGDAGDLQQQLTALQEQLTTLQAATQPVVPNIKPMKNVKVPEGLYNMSSADFRTYHKDILDYQLLTQCSDRQIVLQMRLNMDFDLKRAIDTNYLRLWDAFTVNDTLAAFKRIGQQTSNVAVFRKEFDNMVQKDTENIQEFITRLNYYP